MAPRISFIFFFLLAFKAKGISQQPKTMLPIGHTAPVIVATFSPDEQKIITISKDGTAKLWETGSGKLLKDFKPQMDASTETLPIHEAVFSRDGKNLMLIHYNYRGYLESRFINLQTLEETDTGPDWTKIYTYSRDGKKVIQENRLVSTETGNKTLLVLNSPSKFNHAFFSPDDKTVIAYSDNKKVSLWNAFTGKMLFAPLVADGSTLLFSPDSKKVLATNGEDVQIIDVRTGKRTVLDAQPQITDKYEFSPDAKRLLHLSLIRYQGGESTILPQYQALSVWDALSGKLLYSDSSHLFVHTNSSLFSPDGKKIIVPTKDSSVVIMDAATMKVFSRKTGFKSQVLNARYSPDGNRVITASLDGTVKIWDAQTFAFISEMKNPGQEVYDARFDAGGNKILVACTENTTGLYDVSSGHLITSLKQRTTKATIKGFGKDGNGILFSDGNNFHFWNIRKGNYERISPSDSTQINSITIDYLPQYARNSPDSTLRSQWSVDPTALINIKTGEEYHFSFERDGDWPSVQFSPDSKWLLLTFPNHDTRVFDIKTRKQLFTFIPIDSSDYLIVDTAGRYDGTEAARKLLYYTCGTEIIELSQVKDQLWVPGLAERIIAGYSINAVTLDQLNVCNKAPLIEDLSSDSIYRFKILPRSGGIGKTVVGLNGYEYKEFEKKDLFKTGNAFEIRIPKSQLSAFFEDEVDNTVWVKSTTATGDMPSRVLSKTESLYSGKKTPPNLFAVMVGTSNYKDDRMDLQFAATDAIKMGTVLEDAAVKLLGKEHVFVYTVTTDDKNMYPEKGKIREIFQEIGKRTHPNDILLVFLSGHGVMHEKTKEFYYLTADASSAIDETLFKNTGVSMSELTDWIKPQSIKARKRVLILDACQSGQAINNLLASNRSMLNVKGDEEARQIKAIEKLNERSGLYILSASTSAQSAYESEEYGHGYLTYSLLKGIKENPAILEEGKYLNITRWFNEAAEMVSELSEKDQSRQEPQVVSTSQFNIGLVDQELIQKIQLLSPKPLFVPGNFMNRDEAIADDNLGIRRMIDAELQRLSGEQGGKKIVFSAQSASPDAYSLNGSYLIRDKEINIKIRFKKGDITLNSIDLKGLTDQLPALVKQVVQQAMNWIRTLTKPADND